VIWGCDMELGCFVLCMRNILEMWFIMSNTACQKMNGRRLESRYELSISKIEWEMVSYLLCVYLFNLSAPMRCIDLDLRSDGKSNEKSVSSWRRWKTNYVKQLGSVRDVYFLMNCAVERIGTNQRDYVRHFVKVGSKEIS
jgi:hypothetical protein